MALGLVLFDLDGTLADTAPDIARALNLALAEARIPPLALAEVRARVSAGARAVVTAAFAAAPAPERLEALVDRLFAHYADAPAAATRAFPGMDRLVAQIAARGARWGVVTNKPERLAVPIVAALGLRPEPLLVIGGDSLAQRKPHPLPLLTACQRAGTAVTEALYVGDAEIDVRAARSAGMPVAIAGFGYAPGADEAAAWGPDLYAHDVEELWRHLAARLPALAET